MSQEPEASNNCGWQGSVPTFYEASATEIVSRLGLFVKDASREQVEAWRSHVPSLQREYREWATQDTDAPRYSTILEYQLPYELRRPDVVVLAQAAVVVLEMKGHRGLSQASLDQVTAYARDLRAYHSECAGRAVVPVLVSTAAPRPPVIRDNVSVCHPNDLDHELRRIAHEMPGEAIAPNRFLAPNTYVPLPTVVQAARQLFEQRELPYIKRARAATEPSLQHITEIAHRAAAEGSRHLVLLSGVPGSGKTLVGLQLVHSKWLDDLAELRGDGKKPTSAGVYLSGNDPLVAVLQYSLKEGGGDGKTFVRPIKAYVEYYAKRPDHEPPEHLLVYDEAQRAHDAERVAHVHKKPVGISEPAHLAEFCLRVPGWNVLVALIGSGQAIHVGEEEGLPLWREAIERLPRAAEWTVHCAPQHRQLFHGGAYRLEESSRLSLDQELRFHLASDIDRFVDGVLEGGDQPALSETADVLWGGGHRFLVTRDLDRAKSYLRERYLEHPVARFGLLASSKAKNLLTCSPMLAQLKMPVSAG